jgi:hypothetical protein
MAEMSDRFNKIEEEMEKLKQELKTITQNFNQSIEELKKAIIEVKNSISDIENPFNLLKIISSEEDFQRLKKSTEEKTEKVSEKAIEKEKIEKPKKIEEAPKIEEVVKKIAEITTTSFEAGFSIIKWVWALLDAGFDRDDVLNLSRYCESVGYLPNRSSEYVGYIVDAMSKARLGGLNMEEFMLIIYGAAKASGLKLEMKELEEIAFKLLRKILKKISFEGRQS